MTIVAADPSTVSTGFCIYSDHEYSCFSLQREKNETKYSYWKRLISFIRSKLKKENNNVPDVMIVEGYAFSAHTRGITQLAEIGAIVRYALYICFPKVPIFEITCSTWKAVSLGNGQYKKKDVAEIATQNFVPIWKNQDECDAFLMCYSTVTSIVSDYDLSNKSKYKLQKSLYDLGVAK